MQLPDLVPLDDEQLRNVWCVLPVCPLQGHFARSPPSCHRTIYRSHPTVGSCVQAIRNCVFGGGINMSAPYDARTQIHYEKLAHCALDWIITVGVVPILIRRTADSDKLIPVVPQPEAVKLFVRLDAYGQRRFEGQLQRGNSILNSIVTNQPTNQADQAVMVWSGGEYLPTCKVRSRFSRTSHGTSLCACC